MRRPPRRSAGVRDARAPLLPATPPCASIIERVAQYGCTDNIDGSDFYGRTTIAGEDTNFGEIEDEDVIEPNWTAEKVLDVDTVSSVSVVIKLAETDGGFNFGDDVCDIAPNDGTDLDLTVPLVPVFGDR